VEIKMPARLIDKIALNLQMQGYLNETHPDLPGIQTLLYSRSPQSFRLAFAKVEDHFLFIDWVNSGFSHQDNLIEIYKNFSIFVNKNFPIPHALRMHIPNLVITPISPSGFTEEVIRFARTTYMHPWYGGETGQIILIDANKKQVIFHPAQRTQRSPGPGAFPLAHAVEIIHKVCQPALSDD
jgi:hypothetical protein